MPYFPLNPRRPYCRASKLPVGYKYYVYDLNYTGMELAQLIESKDYVNDAAHII